ncbi:hypothetical protein [Lysinibacter sp. HNR]|uniref:hypothetical protein n=1 Tax=Lysinibacter sp. HNR TaxID=3031408 RepID=UPI0024353521|nr:hypothetical protein [Lysinibacter sp. HNR]WGD38140.1 hypothetical protein FrondiHNR_04270 [Lysinibacter sp. HNR]
MTGDVLGGGVIVGIAALLWAVYFLPLWMRRRQFAATEQNALRIQRTLRVLAESTEAPREIHLEINAREAAAQERILRSELAKQEAERKKQVSQAEAEAIRARRQAEAAAAEAERIAKIKSSRLAREAQLEAKKMAETEARARSSRDARGGVAEREALIKARRARARRVRASIAFILLAGLITVVIGAVSIAFGGTATVLTVGGVTVAMGLVGLKVAAPRPQRLTQALPSTIVHEFEMGEEAPVAAAEEPVEKGNDRLWVPRELPKPLYLTRETTAQEEVRVQAPQRNATVVPDDLRRAAERAARIPHISARTPVSRTDTAVFDVEASDTTSSTAGSRQQSTQRSVTGKLSDPARLRSMGVVDTVDEPGLANLDDVLRRRRNVG